MATYPGQGLCGLAYGMTCDGKLMVAGGEAWKQGHGSRLGRMSEV